MAFLFNFFDFLRGLTDIKILETGPIFYVLRYNLYFSSYLQNIQ